VARPQTNKPEFRRRFTGNVIFFQVAPYASSTMPRTREQCTCWGYPRRGRT